MHQFKTVIHVTNLNFTLYVPEKSYYFWWDAQMSPHLKKEKKNPKPKAKNEHY